MALKESRLLRRRMSTSHRLLITGLVVSVTSQFHFTAWAEGFRISAAVILFPVLLMTLMRHTPLPITGLFTGACVLVARTGMAMASGLGLTAAIRQEYPGAVFYLCYDMLLCLMLPDRKSVKYLELIGIFFLCDLISNAVNLVLSGQDLYILNFFTLLTLLLLAIARSGAAAVLLWCIHFYRQLLQRQEHEQRYQRLFLMTAELKTELYFLKKDAEDIEQVMARAYRLYERLGELGVPQEEQAMALSIAQEVHEIKKDNLRIIRGIEGEVADVYDQEGMRISDLFHILEDSTRRMLGQHTRIRLECTYEDNVNITEHYRLLSAIKNLVTNAVEAIQDDTGHGTVRVKAYMKYGLLHIEVIDDGPGISRRAMRNLFQVGFSTKFDPNTGNISRGVGLPAVKFIVDELEGTLKVDSKPGKGTHFTLALPLGTLQGELP